MSVVQIVEPKTDIRAAMREVGAKARVAAREVANASAEKKNRALVAAARTCANGRTTFWPPTRSIAVTPARKT